MPNYREVAITEIDEPSLSMRETMSDDGLAELAESIRKYGVLQPIRLRPKEDGRFEIVAGHRRLLAAREVGLVKIPAVFHVDEETAIAARVHENLIREDVSPAEEAVYYAQLYESSGEDVDKVAALVGRTRDYVEGRLLLLRGDTEVLAALGRGDITLGLAQELNRFDDEGARRYHLEFAIRAGASVRQMREWRSQANARAELARQAPAEQPSASSAAPQDPVGPAGPSYASMAKPDEFSSNTETRRCLFCDEPHVEWQMFRKYVCQPCADKHLVPEELKPKGGQ